tara:strand:+ start:1531 stop:1917 length:387 start_codon:yes stop_codon:yes gene_type:complete
MTDRCPGCGRFVSTGEDNDALIIIVYKGKEYTVKKAKKGYYYGSALDKLLTSKEAADFLGVAYRTLDQWRYNYPGRLKYLKRGNFIRYRLVDLHQFIHEATIHGAGLSQEGEREVLSIIAQAERDGGI